MSEKEALTNLWVNINWQELFVPSISVLELLRASLVYLVLFSVLRSLPSRQLGTLGIPDLRSRALCRSRPERDGD